MAHKMRLEELNEMTPEQMDEIEDGHIIDRMTEAVNQGRIGYNKFEQMSIRDMLNWLEGYYEEEGL